MLRRRSHKWSHTSAAVISHSFDVKKIQTISNTCLFEIITKRELLAVKNIADGAPYNRHYPNVVRVAHPLRTLFCGVTARGIIACPIPKGFFKLIHTSIGKW
jgi:hypothetical protein